MKKSFVIFMMILVPVLLSGCQNEHFTADNLPWISDAAVLFKDDFNTQTGGWETHEDGMSFSRYEEGGFRLNVNVPNYQFWRVPGLNFQDVHVLSNVMKLGGPDDNLFGLICRYQNENNFYSLVISSDGYYGIFRKSNGVQELVGQEQLGFSERINRGEDINQLLAVCHQNRLALFVNGIKLVEANDDSLSYGDVGIIVGNFSTPGVDVLFENFVVVKP